MSLIKLGRRQETWIIVGLFVLTLLTRIPFRSQILFHWDSVNFAYAMREFDIVEEQPQPPGYVVYVWLCRLVDMGFRDSQTTMVWISVLASALAVIAFFFLGRSLFDTGTGLLAALFLLTSPLFWFYGEVALPHAMDTLLIIVGSWWLYEVMRGHHRYLYPAIVLLAVAAGVRQQTLVFLGPMILFALRKVGWRRFLAAGVLGVVVCLLWFVPLMMLSGGIEVYSDKMSTYTERFQTITSVLMGAGWAGVRYNVRKLVRYTPFAWGSALLSSIAYGGAKLLRRGGPHCRERSIFLALWLVPVLTYYALIHMGQPGLVLAFLPVLLLWGARGLVWVLRNASRSMFAVVSGIVLTLNVGVFCLAPEYPLGEDGLRLWNRAAIVSVDDYYLDRFEAIRRDYPADSTAVLASNWHHVEYYMPEYFLIPVDISVERERILSAEALAGALNADGQVSIVVFDDDLARLNETPEFTKVTALAHGGQLQVLALPEDHVLYYGGSLGVRKP